MTPLALSRPRPQRRSLRQVSLAPLAGVLFALSFAGGCSKSSSSGATSEVGLDQIEVISDKQVLRTATVGHDQWKSDATYVMVEAKNHTDRDVNVTLSGVLTGEGGAEVSELRSESLRVPAGGTRLFALVDNDQKARPEATSAKVRVVGAVAVNYPPPVIVTEGNVYADQGTVDLNGRVVNTADGTARAVVMFAFFDKDGVPLKRASTLFSLAPKATRGAHMLGPKGAVSGSMYIGDVQY